MFQAWPHTNPETQTDKWSVAIVLEIKFMGRLDFFFLNPYNPLIHASFQVCIITKCMAHN